MSITVERKEPVKLESRSMRGALAGSGAFLGVYWAVASGALPTGIIFVTLALLVSMLPLHVTLSGRWAYTGAIVMGWAPLTWWLPLPLHLSRGPLLAASGAAWLAVIAAGSLRPLARVRALLPTPSITDLWIVTACGTAFVVVHRWVMANSPVQALATMISGYDNAGHYDMFSMLRHHGRVIEALGSSPDGSAWAYDTYPQGFHALTAMFAQLIEPHVPTGPTDIVTYTHAVGAVVIAATMLLVGALCSLHPLQRRPLLALPVVSMVCTAYLWEPGPKMLANGFGNFWLAAAATSAAIVLALDLRGRPSVAGVAAVSGALLCAVNCWAPLAILGTPACFTLFWVATDAITSSARRRYGMVYAAMIVVSAVCAFKTLLTLASSVSLRAVVTAWGGIDRPSALPAFILLSVCALIYLVAPAVLRRLRRQGVGSVGLQSNTPKVFGLTPLVGVVSLSALLIAQMRTLGNVSYYFVKYFIGFELVLTVLTATIVALFFASSPSRRPLPGVALSCVAAVMATQFFGHVSWRESPMVGEVASEVDEDGRTLSRTATAAGIVSASDSTTPEQALSQVYLALGEQRGPRGLLPAVWFHAATNSLTTETATRLAPLDTGVRGPRDAAPIARRLLRSSSRLSVIVAPPFVEPLRRELPSALRSRVTSWDEPSKVTMP